MTYFSFKDLKKSFWENVLFENISFSFPKKGFVGLIGNSGCGKTTLFYLLTGLEKADKGTIIYNNKQLKSNRDFLLLRNDCSFIFQEYGVLNYLNGYDNLNLGGFISDTKNNLLSDKHLKKNVGVLSGGEKQRIALLRALKRNPKIVFCDEPTGSLDALNGDLIMLELKKYAKDNLVIMVSHNYELTEKYADIILEIKNKELKVVRENKELYLLSKNKNKTNKNINVALRISIKSFFKDRIKLILTFFAMIFTFSSLFLLINVKESSSQTIKNSIQTYADYERIKVSAFENNEIVGTSFSLKKMYRPKKNLFKDICLEKANIEYNLDYFLSFSKIKYLDKEINMNIITFPFGSGLEDIRINEQAKSIFLDLDEKIEITINQTIYSDFNGVSCSDEINLNLESYIHYVYNEFDFLNYPCLFISHDALKNYMKSVEMKDLSKKRGIFTSLYDRFSALSDDEEAYSSYSLYIDVYRKEYFEEIIADISKIADIEYSSRTLEIEKTLESSFSLIKMLMGVLIFIAIVLNIFLLYLLIYSSIQRRKKEFAIYKTFGYSFSELFVNIALPIFIYVFSGYFLSFAIQKINIILLNHAFFDYFGLNVFNADFLNLNSIVIQMIIILFCILLFSLMFSLNVKRLRVGEVIKSE